MEAFFTERSFWAFSQHHVLRLTSGFLRSIGMATVRAASAAGDVRCCSVRQTIFRLQFDCNFGDFGNLAKSCGTEQQKSNKSSPNDRIGPLFFSRLLYGSYACAYKISRGCAHSAMS
ncbi:unnamed protein product [Ectocarpus sp. 12 AP-2014]